MHTPLACLALAVSAAILCGCGSTVDSTTAGAATATSGAGGNHATTATTSTGKGGAGGIAHTASVSTGGGQGGQGTTSAGGQGGQSTTSGGGQGGAGGGPQCAGLGDPCTDCAAMSCQTLYCACINDGECTSLLGCTGACAKGDAKCFQKCFTQFQQGISPAVLFGDCSARNCPAQCPAAVKVPPCQECLYAKCSTAMDACLADPDCVAFYACAGMCPPADMACGQACIAQHPEGAQRSAPVYSCSTTTCAAACK